MSTHTDNLCQYTGGMYRYLSPTLLCCVRMHVYNYVTGYSYTYIYLAIYGAWPTTSSRFWITWFTAHTSWVAHSIVLAEDGVYFKGWGMHCMHWSSYRLANRRTGRGGGCPSSWTAGTGSSAAFRAWRARCWTCYPRRRTTGCPAARSGRGRTRPSAGASWGWTSRRSRTRRRRSPARASAVWRTSGSGPTASLQAVNYTNHTSIHRWEGMNRMNI